MTRDLPFIIALVLWTSPAAIGLIDVGCWFALGQQCSSVLWHANDGARIIFAAGWTIGVPLLFVLLGAT